MAYRAFTIRQRTYGDRREQGSLTIYHVCSAHYQKKSVLVLAHSNAAVDVLMSEVRSKLRRKKKWTPGSLRL